MKRITRDLNKLKISRACCSVSFWTKTYTVGVDGVQNIHLNVLDGFSIIHLREENGRPSSIVTQEKVTARLLTYELEKWARGVNVENELRLN